MPYYPDDRFDDTFNYDAHRCAIPDCQELAAVVTPEGFLCPDCADDLYRELVGEDRPSDESTGPQDLL